VLKPSPLLDLLKLLTRTTNPTRDVATRLAERFDYVSDAQQFGVSDQLAHALGDPREPARERRTPARRLRRLRLRRVPTLLHDLGVGARVVIGACDTGAGHMVCEDEHGSVIDNRWPGRVLTWRELERIGYRSSSMNSLDFEREPGQWERIAVGADGCRVYA
jgi:hypothetical protein